MSTHVAGLAKDKKHSGSGRNAVMAIVKDAALSLSAKPSRTIGMVMGIILAVVSVTAAVTIADTQQVQIDRRFDAQRSPAVVIQAQEQPANGFDPQALRAVAALGVVGSAGELSIWSDSVQVQANRWNKPLRAALVAADAGGLRAAGVKLAGGSSSLLSLDRPLVWVGRDLLERIGYTPNSPNTLTLEGRTYSVAGAIIATSGFDYLKSSVVMSRMTAQQISPAGRMIRVVADVRPGSAAAVATYALAVLDPGKEMTLSNATPPDGEVLLENVTQDLRMIGFALGLFMGLVGMVAVANTMSMSVNQRAAELGLRAAMGWMPGRIRFLILIESTVAGTCAAIVGTAFGLLLSGGWALTQGWQLIVFDALPAATITLGTLAALVGGLIPAHSAAAISPLEAMRS